MEYTMEELLVVTAELSTRYLTFESSSVTYETAQMLMEAVMYCIEEDIQTDDQEETELPIARRRPPIQEAYQKGYEKLLTKVRRAKDRYELLADNFESYGCENYKSTILEGMPSFFLYYDPIFQPQNHILTLDYPIIRPLGTARGADRIERYLDGAAEEKKLLDCFAPHPIKKLLDSLMPDAGKYFMDNICEAVLHQAVGCVIADREVGLLTLNEHDYKHIITYFHGLNLEQAKRRVAGILRLILKNIQNPAEELCENYFQQLSRGIAVRYQNLLLL